MNEELVKSLEALIDETLGELEELRKSKFSATEVKLDGPGENLNSQNAGPSSDENGSLGKEEDKDDEDEEEKKKKDMEKGVNEQAEKAEAVSKEEDKDMEKGVNEQAEKAEECHDEDPKHEKKEKKKIKELSEMHKEEDKKEKKDDEKEGLPLKKSEEPKEFETLMKSYVDEKIQPLESKLASILELVTKLGDKPVPPKGFTAKMVPLAKSDEKEPLSKGEISGKLFELKKSGTTVDSTDIAKADMGIGLQELVAKYNLK